MLEFFPALEEVKLGGCDLRNLSFVEALPNLRPLQFFSVVPDYRFRATPTFDTFYCEGYNPATLRQLMGREPDEYYPAPEQQPCSRIFPEPDPSRTGN